MIFFCTFSTLRSSSFKQLRNVLSNLGPKMHPRSQGSYRGVKKMTKNLDIFDRGYKTDIFFITQLPRKPHATSVEFIDSYEMQKRYHFARKSFNYCARCSDLKLCLGGHRCDFGNMCLKTPLTDRSKQVLIGPLNGP